MVKRNYWLNKLTSHLKKRSVVWLMGPRRVGKTVLCQSVPGVEYFDCERPRLRTEIEDCESFFRRFAKNQVIALDEIHRLTNPSEVLKIASDYFPQLKVIATGSSTLGVKRKFKDTLTGRKLDVLLTPANSFDFIDFNIKTINHRLLYGGLPTFFRAACFPEEEMIEWLDSFWVKDIQDLFGISKKASLIKMIELLFLQSGGIFEASEIGKKCGISHTTVANYLHALEQLFILHIVRPYSTKKANEIVAAPRVYGFDTGFISYFRGWSELRKEDRGFLWEHLVLNEFVSLINKQTMKYWRTKQGHEIDFVLDVRGGAPIAIECKIKERYFSPDSLKSFRKMYPVGDNWLVCSDCEKPTRKFFGDLYVQVMNINHIHQYLEQTKVKGI